MQQRRYLTNLRGMHQQCEANYVRLLQLIADWDVFESLELAIDNANGPTVLVKITLLERNPYTSTIMLDQQDVLLPWAKGPQLTVRVYHDARMAEVISWNRHRLIKPRYEYPNPQMYLPDEKAQLNQFFGECLSQCIAHGRTREPISIS
ncbi:MAG: DUF1249 domain-containing protein [Pseudomonadales bacterium]